MDTGDGAFKARRFRNLDVLDKVNVRQCRESDKEKVSKMVVSVVSLDLLYAYMTHTETNA